jgi:hypothetical protein
MKKDHRAGAFFLTEPLNNHGWEWRCHMRDPDGYLIEVGQYTQIALDWFNNRVNLEDRTKIQPIPSSDCSKPILLL